MNFYSIYHYFYIFTRQRWQIILRNSRQLCVAIQYHKFSVFIRTIAEWRKWASLRCTGIDIHLVFHERTLLLSRIVSPKQIEASRKRVDCLK